MPREVWQITEDYSKGYNAKRDPTQNAPGTLIYGSVNTVITDGDAIAIRQGSELFGASSSNGLGIQRLHTFKKRSRENIMLRPYGTVLEYYHTGTGAFENLNDGYTSGQIFGFQDHNVNTDATDYVYFCNAVEPYSRWNGAYSQLDGALAGGEATITVDSTLTDDVYDSGTASSVTTTSLTIASGWATDLWNGFYVHITSGAQSGKVALISGTTSTTVTFATITGLSGTPTFEIRRAKFTSTGSLRIGTTNVTYTSIDQENRFAGCSGTPVALDNAAIAQAVVEYVGAPRGNILLVKDTRMFVSGVKKSPSSVYYSKIADATDFSFSSPRVASDGGIIDTPEGGGAVTGLGIQEDLIYIGKEDIIKTLSFTQDENDLPIVDTLIESPQVGPQSIRAYFKVDNQLYFASKEGGIKSVGRVPSIDFVQSLQLSDPISELVKLLDFSSSAGIFFNQKAYISAKQADSTQNDVVLVFNFQKNAWEAPIYGWNANDWTIYNGELYYGDSYNAQVFKVEVSTTTSDNGNAVLARARFSYNNFGSPAMQKKVSNLFIEGYISENTTLTFRLLYNYKGLSQILEKTLSGTDTDYLLEDVSLNALATDPLGLQPLGATIEDDEDLTDINKFRVYFPVQVERFYELTLEVESDQEGAIWRIIRHGFDAEITKALNTSLKK